MFLASLSQLVRELERLKVPFDTLGRCPDKTLIKKGKIDALFLGLFKSGCQLLAAFHSVILASYKRKQKTLPRMLRNNFLSLFS
jgi:hypothetical protein